MNEQRHDLNTKIFYSNSQVAQEYDEARFSGASGRMRDLLQKETLLSLIGQDTFQGKRILDVGCGTGRFSAFFAEQGAAVTAVDLSQAMLQQTLTRPQKQIKVSQVSALNLPFPDQSFDIASSVWVFNHLSSYRAAILEMCRVSRYVVLGLPNKYSLLYVLATLYRRLKGYSEGYTGFTVRSYKSAPIPYSIYFSPQQLGQILKDGGCSDIKYRWAHFIPYIPESGAEIYSKLDRWLSANLSKYGVFMAVSGRQES